MNGLILFKVDSLGVMTIWKSSLQLLAIVLLDLDGKKYIKFAGCVKIISITNDLLFNLIYISAPVLVAIALIESGMSPLDSVSFIRARRRGAINNKQLKYIENYKRRSKSAKCVIC